MANYGDGNYGDSTYGGGSPFAAVSAAGAISPMGALQLVKTFGAGLLAGPLGHVTVADGSTYAADIADARTHTVELGTAQTYRAMISDTEG